LVGLRRIRGGRVGRATAVVLLLVCGVTITARGPSALANHGSPSRPNILLIVTDDQRFDELDHMRNVDADLIGRGVRFTNGLVSDPLCCPSRATMLTGTYSHTNGIYSNANDTGGYKHFQDSTTIATTLHTEGYRTGLIGKYMNGYEDQHAARVPPGWDRWFALTELKYFNFAVSDQGQLVHYTNGEYQTNVLGQKAVHFIRSTPASKPLFLDWAPFAPHGGARPAPKYEGAFAGLPPLRPPSYNEADVSDKPRYVQELDLWDRKAKKIEDKFRQEQHECLLSVDDWIGAMLQALSDTGRLQNTLIVYLSDNGHPLGEHRLGHPGRAQDKASPYEMSLKVPFIARWDAAGWDVPRLDDTHIVSNVDLAETFANAAGTTEPGNEGMSLLPVLSDPQTPWRADLLAEHGVDQRFVPTYCEVRGTRWTYTQYATGEEELYDLEADPDQMQNLAADSTYADVLHQMRHRDHQLCFPTPPGFVWSH
jgi:N-acetylglucosamine-6-sulfatase